MRNHVLFATLVLLVQASFATDFKVQGTSPAVVNQVAVNQVTVKAVTVPPIRPAATVNGPVVPSTEIANRPKVYGDHADDNKDPAAEDAQKEDPLAQIQQMLGGLGAQGEGDAILGANDGAPIKNPTAMSRYVSGGIMADCSANGSVPATVMSAYHEAQTYRSACHAADRGPNQKIAISDYTNVVPTMWIFDANGNCLKKTAITYGNGKGPIAPQACSDDGRHLTPPGFHLTCMHSGSTYATSVNGSPPNDALGECSLEGQRSGSRGVVIHRARAPGTASSWGCSGVCGSCFDQVKAMLGVGALVYNYFGNNFDPGCSSRAGQSHSTPCAVEGQVPQQAEAVGGGSLSSDSAR